MAIKEITIDTRIKTVDSATCTHVFDYGGTLYVGDAEGLKYFNGVELIKVSNFTFNYANAILIGDYIYTGGGSISRYDMRTHTRELIATASGDYYTPSSVILHHKNYIYDIVSSRGTYKTLYALPFNLDTNTYGSPINLGFTETFLKYTYNQTFVSGDIAYIIINNYVRRYSLPSFEVIDRVPIPYGVRYGGAGLYVHDDVVTVVMGGSGADGFPNSLSSPVNKLYNYNYIDLSSTEDIINIPDTVNNCTRKMVGVWDNSYCFATPVGLVKIRYITYDIDYAIYDYEGKNALVKLESENPLQRVLFNKSGDNISYLFTTIDGSISGMFEYIAPDGKEITGISHSPHSKQVTYKFGITYDVSIYQDTKFYIAEGSYRPPATTFDINLYQNSAEVNRVDKTNYLVGVGTLSGALREECSMLTPSIVYQSSDVPTFNYVYIPIFNRYYFVTSLSSVSKNVWRMELNCDVLMSYKTEILLLQGTIRRQENDFNPLLIDDMLPTQNDSEVEIVNIPSNAFRNQLPPTNVRNFVLTTILSQGGSSNG